MLLIHLSLDRARARSKIPASYNPRKAKKLLQYFSIGYIPIGIFVSCPVCKHSSNSAINLSIRLGLLGSFVGGLLVGVAYYSGICFAFSGILHPTQVPVVVIGGVGGLLGTVSESFLGTIGRNPGNPGNPDQVSSLLPL